MHSAIARRPCSIAQGVATGQIDGLGRRSTTVYDNANRAIASVNPLGFRNSTVYDAASRAVARINPLGFRSTTVYDAAKSSDGIGECHGKSHDYDL